MWLTDLTPYNLRSCAYLGDFYKEKLLWSHMAPEGRFAHSYSTDSMHRRAIP